MSFQPSPSRPNFTSIVAACILSGGLITAAIINAHKPAVIAPGDVAVVSAGVGRLPTPPVSKEAVSAQVADQLMKAPQLQSLRADGSDSPLAKADRACKLTGVTVTQVEYSAKDDGFVATLDETFLSASGQSLTNTDYISLHNDGYGTYVNTYFPEQTVNAATGDATSVHLAVHETLHAT